jgi:hypothetical protein
MNTMWNTKQTKTRRIKRDGNSLTAVIQRAHGPLRSIIGSPMTNYIRSKFTYTDKISYGLLSGVTNDYIFRTNSLFAPDVTGGGHQPRYYDTLSPIYNKYTVISCDYEFHFPTNSSAQYTVTVVPVNGNGTFSSAAVAHEYPYSRVCSMSPGAASLTCKGHVDNANLNNRSMFNYLTDDLTSSLTSASPNEVLQLHLVGLVSGVTGITPIVEISLTFDAILWDFIVPPPS